MAQPDPYERDYDFAGFQSGHPSTPLPGDKVNTEFDALASVLDEVLDRIARLQRDDLQLANRCVGYDQLRPEVLLNLAAPAVWATATVYEEHDTVFFENNLYVAGSTHTSGVFATDLASGKWTLVADFSAANAIAALSPVDGGVIIGDGTTWVVESGATVRASLGAQASSAKLTDLANLASVNTLVELAAITAGAAGKAILADATTADVRTYLGIEIVTPAGLGEAMSATIASTMIGSYGTWHDDGDLVTRAAWTVNSTFPHLAISTYDLDLTGHFIHEDATSAHIIGGQAAYYSAIGEDAALAIVKGADNSCNHISGLLLSDHSDLIKDSGGFAVGDHGTILGGAYHIGAGTMMAIVGGLHTQVFGSYSFMGGGKENIIGVTTGAAGDHVMNGMVGGSELICRGKYHGFAGGLANTTALSTRFAAVVGGWNNDLGDGASRDGMAAIGGQDNTVVGSYSAAIAGNTNTVTPSHAVALGGNNNTIESTALRAVVMGQRAVAKAQASHVQASGRFAADGDAQIERIHFMGSGTASVALSVANLGSGIRTLASGEVCGFVAYITGARTDVVGEYWRYRIDGLIKNEAGTVLIAGQTLTAIFESDAAFTATAVVLGGTTLGITITGDALKTTRWTGHVELDKTSLT